MSRFNKSVTNNNKTTNLAGGSAYAMSPELELVSALLTSFLEDKFYQSGKGREQAIVAAIGKVKPKFAAQATIFARNEYGMRSVSHVAAAELANRVKGEPWALRFYDKVVHRPDDITEILAYYQAQTKKAQTHAMRKGFALALSRFDAYQLAKYRGENKSIRLLDSVRLTHPKANDALTKLVKDELRNTDTFEAKISAAGQSKEASAKQEAWAELVKSGKLGYFALLRNLRNIVQEAPEVVTEACEQLIDAKKIRKSLVLPFRFFTAADEIMKLGGKGAKQVLVALNSAMDISIENIPKFEGETLVAVDTSGSMQGATTEKAALFAAMLIKSNMADLMLWDQSTQMLNLNPTDSVLTIAKTIQQRTMQRMGGTNLPIIFQDAQRAYDRIVILTDEQSWMQGSMWNTATTATKALAQYSTRTSARPFVYQWDLQGYGSLQFPENQVATLAGWSDKMFDIMRLVETDKKALIHQIEKVEI